MKTSDNGSVMMETVLVLPILLILLFFIIQLPFVLLAKQMTYYAAYCGARTALVYNPADYAEDGGIVHRAACTALSWISQSTSGSHPITIPTNDNEGYTIPRSDNVAKQVSVEISEPTQDNPEEDNLPLVKVTVIFQCPLLIPLGGRLIASMAGTEGTEDSHGWYSIPIQETCILAKPYSTETFPLIPREDLDAMNMRHAD